MPKLSRRQSVPQFKDHTKYKKYLREDFQYQCVYCSIHENEYGGPRGFTVEHFRPKSLFADLEYEYQNLLYGCNVCNPFKGDDWPSDNPLADDIGYLDPCEHDYDKHFRVDSFEIEGLTPVAVYMIERLHLNRRQLIKLREKRFKSEKTYLETIEAFNALLKIMEADIRSGQPLQNKKSIITNQLNSMASMWERRWKPIYALEDYREEGR